MTNRFFIEILANSSDDEIISKMNRKPVREKIEAIKITFSIKIQQKIVEKSLFNHFLADFFLFSNAPPISQSAFLRDGVCGQYTKPDDGGISGVKSPIFIAK